MPPGGAQAEPRRARDPGSEAWTEARANHEAGEAPSTRPDKPWPLADRGPAGGRRGRRTAEVKPGFTKEEMLEAGERGSAGAWRGLRAGRRRVERACSIRGKILVLKI